MIELCGADIIGIDPTNGLSVAVMRVGSETASELRREATMAEDADNSVLLCCVWWLIFDYGVLATAM